MSMRGAARRAHPPAEPIITSFAWGREVAATLRHSTLPWREAIDGAPLADVPSLGGRDRLSLVAQFAAHQAFLQFAGVGDGECDPAEWAVVQKRGTDCRLVRTAARAATDAPPALTLIQQFAEAVGAPPLDSLRQSWGRAESVYVEIEARLRGDAAADLRWMRRAAMGEIASPQPDGLRLLASNRYGRFGYADERCADTIALAFDDAFIVGDDASPLERLSSLAPLRPIIGHARSESDIVERLVACERIVIVVRNPPRIDSASRRVLDLFAATESGVVLMPGGNDLPDARFFVLSPRLEWRRALEPLLTREWLADFVESPSFSVYLESGAVPVAGSDALANLREPKRSFVAAVALLGTRVSRRLASASLAPFLFGGTLEDLAVDGITTVAGDALVFASDAIREEAATLVPPGARAPLLRVAAGVVEEAGDFSRAAELLIESGDVARAVSLLEQIAWTDDAPAIRAIRAVPRHALSPALAKTIAAALLRSGRYRDARDAATAMADGERDIMLAAIERRTGDYASALRRIESTDAAPLLRAELLYLTGHANDALDALASLDGDEAAYLRAIVAGRFDVSIRDPYLAARLAFYRSNAVDDALAALAAARNPAERIDATLDHLFALFTAGRWREARGAAIGALDLVDETQGDRAAGGILFLLAYLSADDGQWAHASQLIRRLKHFYTTTNDAQRLRETELLVAQLELARGRFDAAGRAATSILDGEFSPQIVEAAALIVDEIDSMLHRDAPMRATGTTANAELFDRYALLRSRRDASPPLATSDFTRALIAWERGEADAPRPAGGAEWLKLFRSALYLRRDDVASAVARDLRIEIDSATGSADARTLRAAATAEFPFAAHDFGPIGWRFATRNRLGNWSEIGSLPALDRAVLDGAAAARGSGDWIACSDREMLFLEGSSSWPAASRDAIAALFRIRSENHRLRRVLEQEESEAEAPRAVEGIVGESPAIRDVFAKITRVARRDVAVCILGESGTGKELVARAIHRNSPRRAKPFTAVNCAALPDNLIESELFGAARGAFTGADRDRPGLIETTDGGTLFLDEIGEMPLAAQAKLLRFLQEGELRRVGETTARTADVRIVTATNRKLDEAVGEGRFREDLYYRICGIEVALPPLRSRASDIPLLAAHFLAREREKHRGGAVAFAPDVDAAFNRYAWPGNVRELQNTVRAAHALAGDGRTIELEHLPARVRGTSGPIERRSYQDEVTRFRRELIEKTLAATDGNQNRAAALLNMSRQALAYQIRELGVLVRSSRL